MCILFKKSLMIGSILLLISTVSFAQDDSSGTVTVNNQSSHPMQFPDRTLINVGDSKSYPLKGGGATLDSSVSVFDTNGVSICQVVVSFNDNDFVAESSSTTTETSDNFNQEANQWILKDYPADYILVKNNNPHYHCSMASATVVGHFNDEIVFSDTSFNLSATITVNNA